MPWPEDGVGWAAIHPEFHLALARLLECRQRNGLSDKQRHILKAAMACSCFFLERELVEAHVRLALVAGATPSELLEAIEVSTAVGIQALTVAAPVLSEIVVSPTENQSTDYRSSLRDRLTSSKRRTRWSAGWQALADSDATFFEACADFLNAPWNNEALDVVTKELVHVVLNASPIHINRDSLRHHAEMALNRGATMEMVTETVELACVFSIDLAVSKIGQVFDAATKPVVGEMESPRL